MPLPQENRYTYADFLAGTEEDREELIEGHFRMMSGPSRAHQGAEAFALASLYVPGRKSGRFRSATQEDRWAASFME